MKKSILAVLLLLLLMPFVVKAETCDKGKISIESATIESKTDNVVEKVTPVIDNGKIVLNVKMEEVGDYIQYQMVIRNNSKNDFELTRTSLIINSEYLDYSFKTIDDSKVIKAGKTKTVYLMALYKKEVSDDSFVDGVYKDTKNLDLNLTSDDSVLVPNTLKNGGIIIGILILLIAIVSTALYMVSRKKKLTKSICLLIGLFALIPLNVYALCKLDLTVDFNVEIIQPYEEDDEPEETYLYSISETLFYLFDAVPSGVTTYNDSNTAMNAFGFPGFIKHKIEEGEITESYVGYEKDGQIYYLRGGKSEAGLSYRPVYDGNVEALTEIFGSGSCSEVSNCFRCSASDLEGKACKNGDVQFYGEWYCYVKIDGSSRCIAHPAM